MKQSGRLEVVDCGLAHYRQVLDLQAGVSDLRRAGLVSNTVLVCEHTPVITLGARASANRLRADRSTLAGRGIDLVEVRRGGGVTAHNPGQLVFYPILDLQSLGLTLTGYVQALEDIGRDLLAGLGVASHSRPKDRGIWVGDRKIASVGVRFSRSVTTHGMAINLCNDLAIFDLIVPCGLDNVEMTSVFKETGLTVSMSLAKDLLKAILRRRWDSPHRGEEA